MIINGTDDPVNPYRGGRSGGGAAAGSVLSTDATAAYFARLNNVTGPPEMAKLTHTDNSDPTWVERTSWSTAGHERVVLYTVHGGGHVVPQPYYRFPSIVGRQTKDLDSPSAIWEFFAGLPSVEQPVGH
jgi:polyhydroxybutyrate depolymerase